GRGVHRAIGQPAADAYVRRANRRDPGGEQATCSQPTEPEPGNHRSPRGRESPAPGGSGAGLSENPAIREWPGLTHLLLKRQLRAISATTGGATAAAATAATTAGGRLRHGQRQAVGLQVAGTGGDVDADVARGAVEGRPVQGGAVGRRDRDLVA